MKPSLRLRPLLFVLATASLAAGCAAPPPASKPTGLAEVMERPAERALLDGIRA
jgi:hypothetical protein